MHLVFEDYNLEILIFLKHIIDYLLGERLYPLAKKVEWIGRIPPHWVAS